MRLRFINGSAMTYFDVRIPGLKMTVVAADGLHVRPVTVDEFRIAVAETFDVIVEPSGQDAFTIFAQAMDRTGFAAGTLAVRAGLRAPVPALDRAARADDGRHGPRRHGPRSMGPTARGGRPACRRHAATACGHAMPRRQRRRRTPATTHARADARRRHAARTRAREQGNPLVDMQTMTPTPKLDDPGIGLRDNGRRVLTYADLTQRVRRSRRPRAGRARSNCT